MAADIEMCGKLRSSRKDIGKQFRMPGDQQGTTRTEAVEYGQLRMMWMNAEEWLFVASTRPHTGAMLHHPAFDRRRDEFP